MNHYDDKTKAQLINELDGMRQRVEALESLAIKGRLAEAALTTHKNQVDALRMVTAEITRELNVETLLRLITQRAVDLVEAATSGAVYLWDEANEVMIPKVWHERGEWMREMHIGIGEGLVGRGTTFELYFPCVAKKLIRPDHSPSALARLHFMTNT